MLVLFLTPLHQVIRPLFSDKEMHPLQQQFEESVTLLLVSGFLGRWYTSMNENDVSWPSDCSVFTVTAIAMISAPASDDEGSTAATDGSTLRTSPAEHGGSVGSESGGSAIESVAGEHSGE